MSAHRRAGTVARHRGPSRGAKIVFLVAGVLFLRLQLGA